MTKKASKIAEAGRKRGGSPSSGTGPQFSAVDANVLHSFVDGAMRHGALVSFSTTRNGSAIVLTILHDDLEGGKYKGFFDEEGLAEELDYWAGVFGE